MAMFGAKKRIPLGSADRLDRLVAAPVQMFGGLPRSLSDRDLVDDLAAADVQMNGGADALPDIKSVGGMPRFSYRGPEVTGRDRLRGIAAALDDFGGGNAFEAFMSGQDKRQRGDYDAAMGGLDKVQQTEPLDRMQAGMGQDERDLFAIAPEMALRRLMPQPAEYDIKDGYLFDKKSGRRQQLTPEVRTSSPGSEYWIVDPMTGMPKVVGRNQNFAPNRSRPA